MKRRLLVFLCGLLAASAIGAAAPATANATVDNCGALFDLLCFQLDVSIVDGGGSITSPDGIDCPAVECSAIYDWWDTTTLTPVPSSWLFSHASWGGDCSGVAVYTPCNIVMLGYTAVWADFDFWLVLPTFRTMNVTKSGTGSGTVASAPAGIDCGATCSYSFVDGTIVTLTPTADAGSTFTGWAGDCTGTPASMPCVWNLTGADANATAVFTATPTHPVTVARAGSGTGTVTSTPVGINCGPTCGANFPSGSGVTLTASGSVSYVTDGVDVTFPLALVGNDDGRLRFKVLSYGNLGGNAFTGVLDRMSEAGQPPGQVQ